MPRQSPQGVELRRGRGRPVHYLRSGDLDAGQLHRLLDLAAKMREDPLPFEGQLHGESVACYVGDSTNVANSLIEAGALAGMHVIVGSPRRFQPGAEIVERASAVALACGGSVVVTEDPMEAADDADAVYTDVWVSMGDESERARRMRELGPYAVTTALMHHAKPAAVFMHCLPARRGEEVMADVIDGPRSVVFSQAANRLPTEQALLWALCSGNWPLPEREDG